MIQKLKKPISILLVFMMVVSLFTIVPISASAAPPESGSSGSMETGTTVTPSAAKWTFKLNSNFSGEWNADTDVVSEQPIELNLAEGDYEFQIVAYEDGNLSSYRGNEQAGSFTENYSQIMYDNGGNAKFHADGGKYTLTYNAGTGVVTIAPVYVAQIGSTNYKTLEAAVAAAQDGNTIKLLANCAGNGIKVTPAGKFATTGLTVDFAGFTYTVDGETVGSTGTETNGFQLLKNNKVTFTNGTITSTKAKILVQNYSDLTLDGMTLTLNNPNYAEAYTLSNNNGNIVIDDTTIEANPAGGFAFDVCRFSSYPSVHVTVTGNSHINGNVEISASGSNAKDGFSLTLESGDMTGNIVVDASAQALVGADNKVTKADTFTKEAPAGYKWEADGEGKQTLVPDYAAKVNGTGYMTFAEAAAARSSNDDVITLLKDAPAYVMSSDETLKVANNGFKLKTPTVEGAYVVKSATADGVTTYTVAEADIEYTSTNGAVSYKTFSSSVISSSGTYKLLKDVNATARIAPGVFASNVTLDLNGHTLTSTAADYGILLSRAGSATSPKTFNLVDTSAEKGGKFVASSADQAIAVGGKYNTVTIGEGVTVEGCVALTSENQTLTVNGTINGGNDFAIATNGSSTKNATITINDGAKVTSDVTAIYLPGTGTTTINGGEITGATGIYQKSGTLNVKGGTITGNGAAVDFTHNGNGAVATGDAIVVESCNYPGGAPTTTISGGTIVSTNAKQIGDYTYQDNTAPAITATSDTLTLPEGLKWIPTETEGVYTIGEIPYVAQNTTTGTKYETLEAAVAAAQDGETIKLLANCAGNGIKVTPAGKFATGLTVDFAGFTYTVDGETVGSTGTETNGFQLLKNNKVTFTNGTITSTKAKILVQNYSDLTLDGMTLTLNNPNYTGAYTLSNNNGDVVIKDTTIEANPAGGFAFDVCRFSSYPSVNVTVTGESHIKGNVEISASKGDAKEGFSLTLESGDMTGNIVVDASAQALVGADNKVTKADTFTKEAPADFRWADNGDGTSTLAPIPYVAKNITTGVKYETLEAAFAAAVDGDTIKVLADCSGNGIKVLKNKFKTKGLTVDFDGHTYTMDGATVGSPGTATQAFQLQYNNKITFKGGTLYSEKALFLVQNYSNLTLDGMTLTLDNPNYAYGYTLSNNYGNTVIKDTTINANPAGKFAFDVCRGGGSDLYKYVNVTVEGNSVINGNVEVDARNGDPKDGFSLNLNSGTLNGEIKLTDNAETAIDNNPDNASVNKKNTFTQDPAEGYEWKDNGDGTSTLVKVQKLFDSYSISLNGNVNLNFYIDTDAIPNYDTASDVTVTFTWDSGVVEYGNHYGDDVAVVDLKTPDPDADGLVRAYVPVNAAQMAHQIHATVYVDNVALAETNDYSVMEYAKTIINGNYDEKTKTLVKEMLNYGAMAQTVFGEQHKDPGVLANSVLSAADRNAISEEMSNVNSDTIINAVETANGQRGATMDELRAIGDRIGGKWYTTSVIFLNGNTLRHYFDDEKEGQMNTTGYHGVQDDWFYYVEQKDIVAKDLDTLYTFTIGGESFKYSVLDYAAAILDSNMGEDAENLAKALYLYNQAANAYFG